MCFMEFTCASLTLFTNSATLPQHLILSLLGLQRRAEQNNCLYREMWPFEWVMSKLSWVLEEAMTLLQTLRQESLTKRQSSHEKTNKTQHEAGQKENTCNTDQKKNTPSYELILFLCLVMVYADLTIMEVSVL